MPVSTPTSEPLGTPTSPPGAACSPPEKWNVQFNRSGGFAGVDESLTLDSGGRIEVQSERPPVDEKSTISQDQVATISEFLAQACPFEIDAGKDNCADCFVYELNIQMDGQTYSVQASDVTLTEDLHPLVDALSQLTQNIKE
jgi:hypothetical protein